MDDLTDEQLAELTADLRALKDEVEAALARAKDAARPVTLDQQSVGRLSRMEAMQSQQLARASRESLELQDNLVRQALRAVEEGTYGECKRCDEPIGYQRLKARPEAAMCVRCAGG